MRVTTLSEEAASYLGMLATADQGACARFLEKAGQEPELALRASAVRQRLAIAQSALAALAQNAPRTAEAQASGSMVCRDVCAAELEPGMMLAPGALGTPEPKLEPKLVTEVTRDEEGMVVVVAATPGGKITRVLPGTARLRILASY